MNARDLDNLDARLADADVGAALHGVMLAAEAKLAGKSEAYPNVVTSLQLFRRLRVTMEKAEQYRAALEKLLYVLDRPSLRGESDTDYHVALRGAQRSARAALAGRKESSDE